LAGLRASPSLHFFSSHALGSFHSSIIQTTRTTNLPSFTNKNNNNDRRLVVCQTNYFWKLGLQDPLWSAGQAVLQHYAPRLPPPDPALADARRLRVVIATRPLTAKAGVLVNQDQASD
jgi:hypothetical protein